MFNRYNYILLGIILCASLVVGYVGFTIQPLDGDLTRIGGYSEKEFGWRQPQEAFQEDFLFVIGKSVEDYDQHYDVVVLGDSFTWRPGISWANHFIAATGMSVITFHHLDLSVEELVRSPQFIQSPPKLFVYESVERLIVERLIDVGDARGEAIVVANGVSRFRLNPVAYAMEFRQREKQYKNLTLRVSEAIHSLKIDIRKTFSDVVSRAIELPLRSTEKPLFSSRNQTDILLYRNDINVRKDWKTHWQDALAGYRRLSEMVESNGSTNLATLIFPDKLSVYADYFTTDQWRNDSVIPTLAAQRNLPRLDLRYKQALEQGMVDVYLPNNTHTSSEANRIATNELLAHLAKSGITQPNKVPNSRR